MTRGELDRVMGTKPNKINSSLYASGRKDQIIYYQSGRTLYVYAENGVVSAVQEQEGATEVSTTENPMKTGNCPTVLTVPTACKPQGQ